MSAFGKRKQQNVGREKRRAARTRANADAMIQTTASRIPVTIVNISASGARFVASNPLPSRQDLMLYVNGISLFGRIIWRRDSTFAMKFEEGLHEHSPAEIFKAVDEQSARSSAFDREATLAALMNPQSSISQ